MSQYYAYDTILQGADEQEALDYAAGFCFDEPATLQSIKYAEHIDTINGVGVYHDYGADYYFFTDDERDTL